MRQVGLGEQGARRGCLAAREELCARGGEPRQALRLPGNLVAAWAVQDMPLARQANGRRQERPPAQPSELAVCFVQPRDTPRHADREVTGQRGLPDVSRRIDVHVARRAGRRGLAEVERVDRAVVLPDHHESAASEVSGDGVHHREGECDGHRGVDRVAATTQNVHTDVARQWMRRHHHRMLGGDGPDALGERPVRRNQRATGHPSRRRSRGRVDSRNRDGRGEGAGDAGGDGDRLRHIDAAPARRHEQQAEPEGSAHAELCTLTRVRVNI